MKLPEKKDQKKMKDLPKGCGVAVLIFFAAIIIGIIYTINHESDAEKKDRLKKESIEQSISTKPYTELIGLEKKYLAEKLFDDYTISTGFVVEVQRRVKQHFKNREAVEFPMNESNILNKFAAVSWDKGMFRYIGDVTAKNSFGVKMSHKYQVDVSIKSKKIKIVDIIVQ